MSESNVQQKKSIYGSKVVAFGDSITYSAPDLCWKHWTQVIAERFQLTLINAGVPGNTTTQGLERIEKDVLDHHPDFVLISFGMNDHVMLDRDEPRVTLTQYRENLVEMVNRIKQIGAEPIFVTTNFIYEGDKNNTSENYYYNRHDPEFYLDDGGAQNRLDKFINEMRLVAEDLGVRLVDVRKECDRYNAREFTVDGVHPNELGNSVYAETIGDYLDRVYK